MVQEHRQYWPAVLAVLFVWFGWKTKGIKQDLEAQNLESQVYGCLCYFSLSLHVNISPQKKQKENCHLASLPVLCGLAPFFPQILDSDIRPWHMANIHWWFSAWSWGNTPILHPLAWLKTGRGFFLCHSSIQHLLNTVPCSQPSSK